MSTYTPTLEQAKAMVGEGNVVPVYRDVIADLETPVSAYLKVARGPYSFLLESVEGGERLARYSFIGTEPYRVLQTGSDGGDPLVAIEDELRRFEPVPVEGLPRFHGGAVGYLAYEVARYYEKLPSPDADPQGFPESIFLFTDTLLVFDHLQHTIKVVAHARLDGDIEASYRQATWKIEELVQRLAKPLSALPYSMSVDGLGGTHSEPVSNTTREKFMENVERAKEYIRKGDTYQIQVSQRFRRDTDVHPFEVYRALRTVNPSPYMYYLELGEVHVVGASPEMLIRVEDGLVETHPIAGTRRRGRDAEDEQRMAHELQTSEKERAEHIMLVDLARNDLGRVCEAGSVHVTQLMAIERYSHVMHMVSHVIGKLRPGVSAYDALRAYFPHGTVTGAPKIRTMEIIAELEGEKRGGYGGCVGYFDMSGNCDTALAIRTIWMKPGVAYVQAAGGVVYDSTPEEEYMESGNKARAMMRAIDVAEQGRAERPRGSLGY